jgi:predicted GH43/DUF377 family glycosyl hydrolase
MYIVKKSSHNPILIPDRNQHWESFATFNMCPVKKGKLTYGLYRAISAEDKLQTPERISVIGIGESKDGIHFQNRVPFITPEKEWEKYGCEDPRTTFFEGKYYTFYTSLSGYPFNSDNIKVSVAISKDLKKVTEKHQVTPFNAKAMALFPSRVGGKVTAILTAHTDMPPVRIAIAQADSVSELWNPKFWEKWHNNLDAHSIDPRRNPYDHVEVGAPPIKTKYGWLLVYSHIQNYFPNPENLDRIFGIEALLLDLRNPHKIIGRTRGPFIVPDESYELSGYVSNIVFPSGVILEKDTLSVYYGAADTSTAVARVSLDDLISTMNPETENDYHFLRSKKNPILLPDTRNPWESKAVFNPAAIDIKGTVHILYRALSEDNTSTIGYASSENGVDITTRLADPIYVPTQDFENKKISGGNSGCEDPRLTLIDKDVYMCYTAFDGIGPPRVAVTSLSVKNLEQNNWKWTKPMLITPDAIDDKDTCLFPQKFKNGYLVLHRVANELCGDYLPSLDFKKNKVKKCIRIFGPRTNSWDSSKVGISAPPIKTKYGWLLLYHGVSKTHSTYRVGFVLLDLKDPTIVLSRSCDPVFEPKERYEKEGIIRNVVFPCGIIIRKNTVFIYYGGADTVVGVATMKLSTILTALTRKI